MGGHPRVRTWTLADLDRGQAYRLWFDPIRYRWECTPETGDGQPLTTRATPPEGRAARKRSEGARDAGAVPGVGSAS